MSSEPALPPPFEVLSRLSWRTLAVSLENIRADPAVEHPLAVFQGLLRFTAAASGPLPEFFFQPLDSPLPARMRGGVIAWKSSFPPGCQTTYTASSTPCLDIWPPATGIFAWRFHGRSCSKERLDRGKVGNGVKVRGKRAWNSGWVRVLGRLSQRLALLQRD